MTSYNEPLRYYAKLGTPIFDFEQTEVLGYWNEDRTFSQPIFRFSTRSQLLGDESALGRSCAVFWSETCWLADAETLQKDFAESPFFFMHPLGGPQAKLGAIRLLLKDAAFLRYFRDGTEALEACEKYAESQAKKTWF